MLPGGDLLTGSLIEIADGVLVFRTPLAGKLLLPIKEVVAVTTASERIVTLKNGIEMRGRLARGGSATYIVSADGGSHRPVNLATVARVLRPGQVRAGEPAPLARPAERRWHALWEGGMLWRSGTEDYSDPFTGLTLRREGDRYHFRSILFLDVADDEEFPRVFRALAEWKLQTPQDRYTLLSVGIERDIEETIDLRGDLTLGAGRAFIADASQRLEADAGIGLTFEYFDGEPLADRFRKNVEPLKLLTYEAGAGRRQDSQELNLRFRVRYERDLFYKSRLFEEILIYPSLTDLGDVRARSESAFMWPVTTRLNLKLNFSLDYEGNTAFRELDKWRTTVGASLVWEF